MNSDRTRNWNQHRKILNFKLQSAVFQQLDLRFFTSLVNIYLKTELELKVTACPLTRLTVGKYVDM